MPVPEYPKLYHICHVDRLASIVADGCLWSDAEIARRNPPVPRLVWDGSSDGDLRS